MAKFAKNSIHDSPELQLNVIRSCVDMATAAGNGESEKLLYKAESDLELLENSKGTKRQLHTQLSTLKARMLCLRDKKNEAEAIMKHKKPETGLLSMEDCLDKMKAFHELGMREHCLALLDKLRLKIEGDSFSSQVVNEYLQRESIERKEIQFTTRELKDMAKINYKENRLLPAYNNLFQALTLAPKDKQIALNLLKVLVQLNKKEPLSADKITQANKAIALLDDSVVTAMQAQRRDECVKQLGLDTETEESQITC